MTVQGVNGSYASYPVQAANQIRRSTDASASFSDELSSQMLRDGFSQSYGTQSANTYSPTREIRSLKRLPSFTELMENSAGTDMTMPAVAEENISPVSEEPQQPLQETAAETEKSEDYTVDEDVLNALFEESFGRVDNARQMLTKFFSGDESALGSYDLLKMFTDGDEIDIETAHDMFESLSGLDWTGEASAQRIFDMAKTFADGDSDVMEMMRSAVLTAFSEVENSFGGAGSLPKEAYDTLERVSELFNGNM